MKELDRIPPGLWAPIPIPAIKYLVRIGHRPASRILYAIVLHKGKAESAIFPSYETIALYAYVSENRIRSCLDTLENLGFIEITKTRVGSKNRNEYKILDKAYQLALNPKSETSPRLETMICNTCWDDVEAEDIEVTILDTWEGKGGKRYLHRNCQGIGGYRILIPISEHTRANQRWQKSILEMSAFPTRD